MWEVGVCSTLFPYEIWVSSLKEHLLSVSIFRWGNHSLYEKYHQQHNGETHASFAVTDWVLESCVPCTLFPSRIELDFEWNTEYILEFSSGRNIDFVHKRPIQMSWRNMCISLKKTIYIRRGETTTLFP
jgi:hypothetical protein